MCISKLEELTNELIQVEEISIRLPGHTKYDLQQGKAVSFDLFRTPEGDGFRTFLEAGTIFPLHQHSKSDETFILLSGKVSIVCETEEESNHHKLEVGVPFLVRRCVKHFLSVAEDSWLIAVIVPPDSTMLK